MKKLLAPTICSFGWLEATWIDRTQAPDTEIPATESEPARTEPGAITETQVWCQSYHPTQIADLRAKAAEYGTPLDEYEPMLAEWVASYEPPPPTPAPVPATCTRRQGRLALLQAGYLSAVEQSIATITDPAQRMAAQIEYEADTWERDNAFLQGMWAQLGGTAEQLDDLFRLASTL